MIKILNGDSDYICTQIERLQKEGWRMEGPMIYAGFLDPTDSLQYDYYAQMMVKEAPPLVLDDTKARVVASVLTDVVQGELRKAPYVNYQEIEDKFCSILRRVEK